MFKAQRMLVFQGLRHTVFYFWQLVMAYISALGVNPYTAGIDFSL